MKTPPLECVFHLPIGDFADGESIRLACISRGQGREIWIRQSAEGCVLEIHQGKPGREEVRRIDLPISEFDHLWSSSTTHRVALTRSLGDWNGQPVINDTFPDLGKSLARVAFTGSLQARRFRKPSHWGAEVKSGCSLRDIALHGFPEDGDLEVQAGAVPFLHKKGVLHIVLITNSSGTRWIIPKGRLEEHLTPQEVALMEAA